MAIDASNTTAARSKLQGPRTRRKEDEPVDLAYVLLQEQEDVLDRRRVLAELMAESIGPSPTDEPSRSAEPPSSATLADYCAKAHACNPGLSALCLSGGGIRSAAFGLGIIQGLARLNVIQKFDYLSTVSGGGYIASWLTAWVQRQADGYKSVINDIASNRTPERGSPIQYLWRYTNYLTPKTGIFSTDLMTVVTLYLRNLFLNWLVIVPIVVAAIIAVKLLAASAWIVPADWLGWLAALAMILIGWALLDSLLQRPGWERKESDQFSFWLNEAVPMVTGAFLASIAAITFFQYPASVHSKPSLAATALTLALSGALLFALAWLIAFYFARYSDDSGDRHHSTASVRTNVADASYSTSTVLHVVWTAISYVFSGAIAGLALGTAIWALRDVNAEARSVILVCFGLPLVICSLFLADLIYSGLNSYAPWGDAEREWLARAGGRHTKVSLVWSCVLTLVIVGPIAVFALLNYGHVGVVWFIASSGGGAAAALAILGKVSATTTFVRERLATWSDISIRTIVAIAAPLFVIVAVSFISSAIDYYEFGRGALTPDKLTQLKCAAASIQNCGPIFKDLGLIFVGAAAIGLIASVFVNINRFSLHGVYRNRLIRAFLGASRPDRDPNPFTDFDEMDNIPLQELWPMQPPRPGFWPPQLFVINMALNILNSRELAWQERKALPFIATSRFIGGSNLPWVDIQEKQRVGCFRSSKDYNRGRMNAKGMTLGTAMTLSGAAASPSMGYHSSAGFSVLLTLFNVRLGGWFGNPGPAGAKSFTRAGPTFSAMPLLYEALGMTNDRRRFVYLSDGGHFENLGIYEMIRRRCRYIVVSDAGNDPACTFEDLGNAVRKASVDFGVKIEFDKLDIHARANPPQPGPYAAVASIYYPEPESSPGKLLYIKPGFHGGEPASVRSYGELHPEFPHESTVDQWFAESQFEAYRSLGEYIVAHLVPESERADCIDPASLIQAAEETCREFAEKTDA